MPKPTVPPNHNPVNETLSIFQRHFICVDCGVLHKDNLHGTPAIRCVGCWRKLHRREGCHACVDCGRVLHRTAVNVHDRCRPCLLASRSTKFKDKSNDEVFGHWLSGFVDGEGNFNGSHGKRGFAFRIILHERDRAILETIRDYFGVGQLYYRDVKAHIHNWQPRYQSVARNNQWAYVVNPVVDLARVIAPHFDQFPLRAFKREQFERWKREMSQTVGYREMAAHGLIPPLVLSGAA